MTATKPTAFDPGLASRLVAERIRQSATYRAMLAHAQQLAAASWQLCATVELARAAGGRAAITLRAIDVAIAAAGSAANQELGSKMFPATPASVLRQDMQLVRVATEAK